MLFIYNFILRSFKNLRMLFLISLVTVTIISLLCMKYTWIKFKNGTLDHALEVAKTAEASFQKEPLSNLDVSPKDLEKFQYQEIKNSLIQLVKINKDIRFAYIYTQKEGKLYFVADSEPINSKDYSPPGQEYTEADKAYMKPFEDGKVLVSDPVTDRWETWISVLVPMKDMKTGKTIAVFGTDYPVHMWDYDTFLHTLQSGVLVVALYLLLLAFYWVSKKNQVLKKSEQKYRLLFTEMNEAFSHHKIICDECGEPIDYRFISVNTSFEKMTGLKAEDLIGKTIKEVLPNIEQSWIEIYGDVALKGESAHFESYSKELNRYYEVKSYRPAPGEFATIFTDITKRKKNDNEILYLSYHDVLTGLYNRRYYEDEIKRLDSENNLPISIVIGDVNGLKLANDAFGHSKGDELLIIAARAIKSACRRDDIIARWGGDEFFILLPKTDSQEVEKIVKRINDIYAKENVNSISGSISFGWDTKKEIEEDIRTVIKNAEDDMYRNKISKREGNRSKTIWTIINTLHDKNPREALHSQRVSEICQTLGRIIGLSETEVSKLKTAGLLHDIGKIAIEESILNKSGKLSDQEFEEIKRHPEIGYRIISSSSEMLELADFILAHHERWDGLGYPKGLKGEDIPKVARIIALSEAYDAMTSERSYRRALSEEEAIAEIKDKAGTQFDPDIARVFIEKVLAKQWD